MADRLHLTGEERTRTYEHHCSRAALVDSARRLLNGELVSSACGDISIKGTPQGIKVSRGWLARVVELLDY